MIVAMLEEMGIDRDRYTVSWVSSAEPDKFAAAVTNFTNQVKQLGPIKTEPAEEAA